MNTENTETKKTIAWVLYDADCGFCSRLALRWTPLLHRHGFALAPLQSAWARERLAADSAGPLAAMALITSTGAIYRGADAIVQIARDIWWARPLHWLSYLPGVKSLLRCGYKWVAERRHCINGACDAGKKIQTLRKSSGNFRAMNAQRVIVVGGGAAGFFAAITCAETMPVTEVTILEKGAHFLSKVRISGGGRCNVTHACFDATNLTTRYPRGERALLAPFKLFQALDTVKWFESRGVQLKTESDGRMFPTTDSSQTIIDCLVSAAERAGVKLLSNCGVAKIAKRPGGGFDVTLANGEQRTCEKLLLATGGCRSAAGGELAVSLGHTLEPPVPSLFTFHVDVPWVRELSGVSVEATASVPGTKLRESGAILMTHWGLSGPVILRLSAWGARALHELNYQFSLHLNWLPRMDAEKIGAAMDNLRDAQPARFVVNTPIAPLPGRLWEQLVVAAGIARETRWAALSRSARHALIQQLIRTILPVTGKSLNKDEFVTCGGVRLSEVNFKTMESRLYPGLYFAGELLDIDGITGGFNFQSAWTTGWIAGRAMAA